MGIIYKVITSYNSINDAARSLNIDRTMISMCCRKKRCSAGGFQWRYSDDNNPQKYNSENKKMRPVRQYDLTGLFVAEFDSISKAEKQLELITAVFLPVVTIEENLLVAISGFILIVR